MGFLSKCSLWIFFLPIFLILSACDIKLVEPTQSTLLLSPLPTPVALDTSTEASLDAVWQPVKGDLNFVYALSEEIRPTSYKLVIRNTSTKLRRGETLSTDGMEVESGYRFYEGNRLSDRFFVFKILNDFVGETGGVMDSAYLVGNQAFRAGMGTSWQISPRLPEMDEQIVGLMSPGELFGPPVFGPLLQEPPTDFTIETINGVETYHYSYRKGDAVSLLQAMQATGGEDRKIDELVVDLWMMPENNLVIKYVVEIAGTIRQSDGLTLSINPDGFSDSATYELSEINTDYVVEAPSEALVESESFRQAAITGELTHPRCSECVFPLPVGSIVHGYDPMGSFKIEAPSTAVFDDVKDFYIQKLPEYDWTIESSQVEHMNIWLKATNGLQQFQIFIRQFNADQPVEISIN